MPITLVSQWLQTGANWTIARRRQGMMSFEGAKGLMARVGCVPPRPNAHRRCPEQIRGKSHFPWMGLAGLTRVPPLLYHNDTRRQKIAGTALFPSKVRSLASAQALLPVPPMPCDCTRNHAPMPLVTTCSSSMGRPPMASHICSGHGHCCKSIQGLIGYQWAQ